MRPEESAESCPACGHHLGGPGKFETAAISATVVWHTAKRCPGCHRPLIWFKDGPLAGAWRLDEVAERRDREPV